MIKPVAVHEAKIRLSELIVAAESGESIVITRRGKPVARLVAAVTADDGDTGGAQRARSAQAMAALKRYREATTLGMPLRAAIDDGRD